MGPPLQITTHHFCRSRVNVVAGRLGCGETDVELGKEEAPVCNDTAKRAGKGTDRVQGAFSYHQKSTRRPSRGRSGAKQASGPSSSAPPVPLCRETYEIRNIDRGGGGGGGTYGSMFSRGGGGDYAGGSLSHGEAQFQTSFARHTTWTHKIIGDLEYSSSGSSTYVRTASIIVNGRNIIPRSSSRVMRRSVMICAAHRPAAVVDPGKSKEELRPTRSVMRRQTWRCPGLADPEFSQHQRQTHTFARRRGQISDSKTHVYDQDQHRHRHGMCMHQIQVIHPTGVGKPSTYLGQTNCKRSCCTTPHYLRVVSTAYRFICVLHAEIKAPLRAEMDPDSGVPRRAGCCFLPFRYRQPEPLYVPSYNDESSVYTYPLSMPPRAPALFVI
ncbi:uncharacterized protein BT62DRAFT_1012548 [Guyanagaster necrorhizus]|uniref:Uncharacterized protein n=1 Tax=Guyanagaster necrorhizus TaxID=856835 RepID=A0A9P8AM84_9AGAR|nr:uncharacterized protein BT62DRAFT_1012548 [Guyanagaster necrorhizus MCA 3950]KAG7440615.1 hypothetical protein BT62DRAFT_1012548 [Guyanagaster necrorhizus MCA 3950]